MNLKEQNIRTFNKVAKTYDRGLVKRWSYLIQEKVIESLNIKKNSKILDVGCGTGILLLILSKREYLDLYGIDISKEMLKIAKSKLQGKAKFKLISIENLNYRNKFDYVFSVDAFHHFYNQDKALQDMISSLKKMGTLVIVDVDFGFIFNRIFERLEPGNNGLVGHEGMKRLFKSIGLKEIKQKKIWHFTYMTIGKK